MSIWLRLFLGGNLLVLTAFVTLTALKMWKSPGEQATLEPTTVSAMITAIERTLDRDLSVALSRVAATDHAPLSEEALRTAVRTGIEEALADKTSWSESKGESRASPSAREPGKTAQSSPAGSDSLTNGSRVAATRPHPAAGAPESNSPGAESPPAQVGPAPPLLREPGANRKIQEVHFSYNQAKLTPSGLRKARAAAETIKSLQAEKIRVVGYTDTVGKAPYNFALSKRRATAVAQVLVRAGIPRQQIEIVGRGEKGTPEATANDVDEPMNRCVGIFTLN